MVTHPLHYTSVSLDEVRSLNNRLDASAYNIEARAAFARVKECKYGSVPLWGENGIVELAYHPGRFKREYIPRASSHSVGFLGSSEMLGVFPEAEKFIKNQMGVDKELFVKKDDVLLSCSGTIGNTTFVNSTLIKYAYSQHIIRLRCSNFSGYIYACIKSDAVQAQLQSLMYGAVIQEIEPEHLRNIIIPDAPDEVKRQIHSLVVESYDLRDQSNELIDEAEHLLCNELQLPPIEQIVPKQFVPTAGFVNFTVAVSQLGGRLDGSFHAPLSTAITSLIGKTAAEVTTLGDSRVSKKIILPGRFKRTYVDSTHGVPFIGGKQLLELDPSNKKYLSVSQHGDRIAKELLVNENMIGSSQNCVGAVMRPCSHARREDGC